MVAESRQSVLRLLRNIVGKIKRMQTIDTDQRHLLARLLGVVTCVSKPTCRECKHTETYEAT